MEALPKQAQRNNLTSAEHDSKRVLTDSALHSLDRGDRDSG